GQFEEAIPFLEAAGKVHGSGGNAHNWFFLAMAHHRLGHADEARRWLEKAVGWIEPATQGQIKDPRNPIPLPWNDRANMGRLRREAEALILGKPAPATTKESADKK